MMIVGLIRAVIFAAVVAGLFWLAGLTAFVAQVKTLDATVTDADAAPVDAIVVLTGGSERLSTSVDLLKAGRGKKLFISGVHPGLGMESVLNNEKVGADLRACCITLGHAAESTQGNAEETQNWLALENYHSMLLVTASYHMPRSLLLFHALMPNVLIIPHPVTPESVKLDGWWMHPGTANLMAVEYDKYLWAELILWIGMP